MKRILVGLDGSKRQESVLQTARLLGERLGAKLILFRAVGLPMELPAQALGLSPEGVERTLGDLARGELEAAAKTLPPSLVERVQIAIGMPWRAICDAAKQDGADLIVVGSHGYGGVDRLIGTTAAKVVNHADCSVLVSR
jgi:nucleotide-binding universal stress UspA family protein